MAGTKDDFVIYDVEFHSGVNETLEQNAAEIETGVAGAIRMISVNQRGDFEKESFFKNIANVTSRRDPDDITDAAGTKLTQEELSAVKINGMIGPVYNTLDSFKKIGSDPAVFSFLVGQQAGVSVSLDWINTGVLALTTAMQTETDMVLDIAGGTETDKTLNAIYLNQGLALLGDRASRVRAWVMHSKPFFDLVGNQILDKVTGISDTVVYGGAPGTLGRPVYVTDSPALINGAGNYIVLGLTEDALVINQSEDQTVATDLDLGKGNILMVLQGEYAFTIKVKGFRYTGAAAPDDSVLGNAANWNYEMDSVKSGPGVVIIVEGS